jgi:hypothetical protein
MANSKEHSTPTPPHGYGSWLEYAISTFDARTPTLDSIWSDAPTLERDEVISIVWREFNTLRQAAGLPVITRN